MPYSFQEHTADIRMRVIGQTKEELFRDALRGMAAALKAKRKKQKAKLRKISVQSSDISALLVDFLNEANYFRQTYQEVYSRVTFHKFSDTELEATLKGKAVEEFGEDVKAVTYHEADLKKNTQGLWETTIVFDV